MITCNSIDDLNKIDDNYIEIGDNVEWKKCKITFNGKNNVLIIEDGVKLTDVVIGFKGNDSIVYISKTNFCRAHISIFSQSVMFLGENSTQNQPCKFLLSEHSNIVVCDDCMFANTNILRTSDNHMIFDGDTGKRVNFPEDIYIGRHVWLTEDARVLKGVKIGSGAIVGNRALVVKDVECNTIVGGIPAKKIKENVFWERPVLTKDTIEDTNDKVVSINREKYLFNSEDDIVDFEAFQANLNPKVSVKEKVYFLKEYRKKSKL